MSINSLDIFELGESIPRTVWLSYTDTNGNEQPFDTSDFNTIEIQIYHKHSLIEIASKSLAAGTVTLEAPTSDGYITFIVEDSETTGEQPGIYVYEILTTETDVDYEANTRTRKFKGDCFILQYSKE